MTNNEVIRRVRYMLDFNDAKMISVFKLADLTVKETELKNWMRKEEDPLLVEIPDKILATFLNGLIIEKRGKREGPQPEPEDWLTNNLILMKLRIAFNLTSDDILDLFATTEHKISRHELSSFLRKREHRSYRTFLDQYLRNFLTALQTKMRAK